MNVVGTGSDGSIPSVLFSIERYGVYSDDVTLLQRYLFNCGEGTQRICKEYQIKVNTLNSVFLTQFTNWVKWTTTFDFISLFVSSIRMWLEFRDLCSLWVNV